MAKKKERKKIEKIWIESTVDAKAKPSIAKYFPKGKKVFAEQKNAEQLIEKGFAKKIEAPKK